MKKSVSLVSSLEDIAMLDMSDDSSYLTRSLFKNHSEFVNFVVHALEDTPQDVNIRATDMLRREYPEEFV